MSASSSGFENSSNDDPSSSFVVVSKEDAEEAKESETSLLVKKGKDEKVSGTNNGDRTGETYDTSGGMPGSVALATGQQTEPKGQSTTKSEVITTHPTSKHERRVSTDGDQTKLCRDKTYAGMGLSGEGLLSRNRTDSQGGDTAVGTTKARATSPSSSCHPGAVTRNYTHSNTELALERDRAISEKDKLNDKQNTAGMDQDPEQLRSDPGRQMISSIDSPDTDKQRQSEKARGRDSKSHRSVTEGDGVPETEANVDGKSTTDREGDTKHTSTTDRKGDPKQTSKTDRDGYPKHTSTTDREGDPKQTSTTDREGDTKQTSTTDREGDTRQASTTDREGDTKQTSTTDREGDTKQTSTTGGDRHTKQTSTTDREGDTKQTSTTDREGDIRQASTTDREGDTKQTRNTDGEGDTKQTSTTDRERDTKHTSTTDREGDTKHTSPTDREADTKQTSTTDREGDTKHTSTTDREADTKQTSTPDREADTKQTSKTDGEEDTKQTSTTDRDGYTKQTNKTDGEEDTKHTSTIDREGDTKQTSTTDREGDTKQTSTTDREGDTKQTSNTDREGDTYQVSTTDREGDTKQTSNTDGEGDTKHTSTTDREGDTKQTSTTDRERDTKQASITDREGDTKQTSNTDGEGDTKQTSTTDREGDTKQTSNTDREGDTKQTSNTDREGDTKHTSTTDREGDTKQASTTGGDRHTKQTSITDREGDTKHTSTTDREGDTKQTSTIDREGDTKQTSTTDREGDTKQTSTIDREGDTKQTSTTDREGDTRHTSTTDGERGTKQTSTTDREGDPKQTSTTDGKRGTKQTRMTDREGDTKRTSTTDGERGTKQTSTTDREGDTKQTSTTDGKRGTKQTRMTDREGDTKRTSTTDGERGTKQTSTTDREGDTKHTSTTDREGDPKQTSTTDREGDTKQTSTTDREGDTRQASTTDREGDTKQTSTTDREGDTKQTSTTGGDRHTKQTSTTDREGDTKQTSTTDREGDIRQASTTDREGDTKQTRNTDGEGDTKQTSTTDRERDTKHTSTTDREGDTKHTSPTDREADTKQTSTTDGKRGTKQTRMTDREGDTKQTSTTDRDGYTKQTNKTDGEEDTKHTSTIDREGDTKQTSTTDREGDTKQTSTTDREGDTKQTSNTDREGDTYQVSTTDREGDTKQTSNTDGEGDTKHTSTTDREGDTKQTSTTDRERDTKQASITDREGDTKQTSNTDGEGDTKQTSTTDREGDTKQTSNTDREGDTKQTSNTDREGDTKHTSTTDREGDTKQASTTGGDRHTKQTSITDREGDTKHTSTTDREGDTKQTSTIDREGDTKQTSTTDREGDTKQTSTIDREGDTKQTSTTDREGDTRHTSTTDGKRGTKQTRMTDREGDTKRTSTTDGERGTKQTSTTDREGDTKQTSTTDGKRGTKQTRMTDREGDTKRTSTTDGERGTKQTSTTDREGDTKQTSTTDGKRGTKQTRMTDREGDTKRTSNTDGERGTKQTSTTDREGDTKQTSTTDGKRGTKQTRMTDREGDTKRTSTTDGERGTKQTSTTDREGDTKQTSTTDGKRGTKQTRMTDREGDTKRTSTTDGERGTKQTSTTDREGDTKQTSTTDGKRGTKQTRMTDREGDTKRTSNTDGERGTKQTSTTDREGDTKQTSTTDGKRGTKQTRMTDREGDTKCTSTTDGERGTKQTSTTDREGDNKLTPVLGPSEETPSMPYNEGDHSLPDKRKYTAGTKGPGSHAPYMLTLKIVVQTPAATAVDPLTESGESSLSISKEDYFRIYFFCINKEADADLHQLCHNEITFYMSSDQLKCTICTERELQYLQSSTYPRVLQEWLDSAMKQIIYSEIPIRGLDISKLRNALDANKLNAYLYFDNANPEKLVQVCKLKEERHISMHVQAIVKRMANTTPKCDDPSGKGQMDTWTGESNYGTKGQESDSQNNYLSHEDQMDSGAVDEKTQWAINVQFLYKTAGSTDRKSIEHNSLGEDAFLKWQYMCERHQDIFRTMEQTIQEQLQVDTSICYHLGKLTIDISSSPELATDNMCTKVMSACLRICETHIGLNKSKLRGQEEHKVIKVIERKFGNSVSCHTDPSLPDVLISLGQTNRMGEIHEVIPDIVRWLKEHSTCSIVVNDPVITQKVLEQLGIYQHVQSKFKHIKLSLDKTEDGKTLCLLESVYPDGKLKDADETVRHFLGKICIKSNEIAVLNKNAFNEHVEQYFTQQFSKEAAVQVCMVPDTAHGRVNIFALDKETAKQCFGILTNQFYEEKMTIKKIKRPIEPRDVTAIEQEHEGLLSIMFDTDKCVVYITGIKKNVKKCKQALKSPSAKLKQSTCCTDSDHQATEMKIDPSTDVLEFVKKTVQYQRLQKTCPFNVVFRPEGGYLLKGEPAIGSNVVKELNELCGKVTSDMVTLHGDGGSRWMKSTEGERLVADVSTGEVTVTVEYQDTSVIYGTGSEAGSASLPVDRKERQQKGTWVFAAGHQLKVMMCDVQQCDAQWIVRTDSSTASGNRHPKEVTLTVPKWQNKENKEKHNLSVEVKKLLEKMMKMSATSIGFPVGDIESWPFNQFWKRLIHTVKEYLASPASKGMIPFTVLLCTPAEDEVTRVSKMCAIGLVDLTEKDIMLCTPVEEEVTRNSNICDTSLMDLAEKDPGIEVHVRTGSLSHFKADVLVVSVTPNLDLTKGMIAKALSKAAGTNLQKECNQNYPGKIQAGQIVHTKGHKLKCKHVFYGVLPPFSAGKAKQQPNPECSKEDIENIRHFVSNCLKKAEELGCSSIAFPALGTGNLNYPVKLSAAEMFNAVDMFLQSNTRTAIRYIFFVLYDEDISCIRAFEDRARERSETVQWTVLQRTDFHVFSTTLKIFGYSDAVCKARGQIEKRLEQQGILVDRESTKWAGRQIPERQSQGAEPPHAAEKRRLIPFDEVEERCIFLKIGNGKTTFADIQSTLTEFKPPCYIEYPFNGQDSLALVVCRNKRDAITVRNCLEQHYDLESGIPQVMNSFSVKLTKEIVKEMHRTKTFDELMNKLSKLCVNYDVREDEIYLSAFTTLQLQKASYVVEDFARNALNINLKKCLHVPEAKPTKSYGLPARACKKIKSVSPTIFMVFNALPQNKEKLERFADHGVTIDHDGQDHCVKLTGPPQETENATRWAEQALKDLSTRHIDEVTIPSGSEVKMTALEEAVQHTPWTGIGIGYVYVPDNKMVYVIAETYDKAKTAKHQFLVKIGVVKLTGRRGGHRAGVGQPSATGFPSLQLSTSPGSNRSLEEQPNQSFNFPKDAQMTEEFITDEGMNVKVYEADLLRVPVDCIVNAANGLLQHGGGVARVIAQAAGYDLTTEGDRYVRRNGVVPVGQAMTTTAGRLSFKCVVHTVGPCWYDYSPHTIQNVNRCERDLFDAIMNSFKQAEEKHLMSIALPAVSSAIFGVPGEICVEQYARATLAYSKQSAQRKTRLTDVHFVDKNSKIVRQIQAVFRTYVIDGRQPAYDVGQFVKSQRSSYFSQTDNTPIDTVASNWNAETVPDTQREPTPPLCNLVCFETKESGFHCQVGKQCVLQVYRADLVNVKDVDICICSDDNKGSGKFGLARGIIEKSGKPYAEKKKEAFQNWQRDGSVVNTFGGKTNYKHILYAILPHRMVEEERQTILRKVFTTVLVQARTFKAESLALPLIGTGKDPSDDDVQAWLNLFMEFYCSFSLDCPTKPFVVHLVTYDYKGVDQIKKAVKDLEKKSKKQHEPSCTGTDTEKEGEFEELSDAELKSVGAFENRSDQTVATSMPVDEDCVICIDTMTNPKTLKCGHRFCRECIDDYFNTGKQVCPNCGTVCGIISGDQPEGTMIINTNQRSRLTGFDTYGTISITYRFPNGTQGPHHPNPGNHYKGITRIGYLPDNKKGKLIAKMLKVAFDRKLVFTIGSSRTTGEEGVITWNDIHHKTNTRPHGQFGYPDETYLERVTEELAAKGVTEADV